MWQCLLLAFAASFSLSIYSVNRFSNIQNNPPALTLILLLSLYIPFSIIFLLPIDLISSSFDYEGIPEEKLLTKFFFVQNKKVILNLWRVNYWLGFVLTWLILPIVQSYYSSNFFKFKDKLKDSIIYNLKFYSIYAALSVVGLIYVFLNFGMINLATIKSLVIVLSHSYSLILAIWFMGHGLISLPKDLVFDSLIVDNMREHYYLKIIKLKDEYQFYKNNLRQSVILINKLYELKDFQRVQYHKEWIVHLYESWNNSIKFNNGQLKFEDTSSGNVTSSLQNFNNYFNEELSIVNDQLSDEFLINVTKIFTNNYYNYLIAENSYYHLTRKIIKIQDIKDSKVTKELEFRVKENFKGSFFFDKINFMIDTYLLKNPRVRFWYYNSINPAILRVASISLFFLSLIVILSELFHGSKLSIINLILFKVLVKKDVFIDMFILLLLCYMCLSSLISLSRTKIFLIYKLITKNSNPSSCVWYSAYAIRLTIPLSYNFLTILNKQILTNGDGETPNARDSIIPYVANEFNKTQFAIFLGNSINMIPLGQTMNNILPYFIILPLLVHISKVLNKRSSFLSKIQKRMYLDELDFLLWDDNFDSTADSPNEAILDNKVNDIIRHELENSWSLLNNYDDTYTIFYDQSLKKAVEKLKKMIAHKGEIELSEQYQQDSESISSVV